MHDDKDRVSKWMLSHHGDSLLRLGGIQGFTGWKALMADVVQPRRLPDGLIEASFPDRAEPDLVLVEVFSYPDARAAKQIFEKMTLVFLDRGVVPDVLAIYLMPRGAVRVPAQFEATSRWGHGIVQGLWRNLELWTIPAAEMFQAGDVGLVPWIPLTQFTEPPEVILQQCRDQIEQQAPSDEKTDLLVVSQIMTSFRYNDEGLLAVFGGSRAMIESPLIIELLAKTRQEYILQYLEARFGPIPPEIVLQVRSKQDEKELEDLLRRSATCASVEAFRSSLEG